MRGVLLVSAAAVLAVVVTAAAGWSGPLVVSDSSTEAYGYFTQSVGPDGNTELAWVKWSAEGDPQTVESREVGPGGSLGAARRLSSPDPSAFGTYVSGLDIAHGGDGSATAAWLEIVLTGSSCVAYGYGYSFGGEEDCVVHYYAKARRLPAAGALGPVRTLGESEYSPGTVADSTYLHSPQVVVGATGAATVAWTRTMVSAGCSNHYGYGYGYGYENPPECSSDTAIEARGIDAAGVPDVATLTVFESHSSNGYGRSELGDVVVASDGTVSLAWLKAPSLDNYYCAGGSEVGVEIRQIDSGGLGPVQTLDSGEDEGECGWTAPRAAVSAGGSVTVAWGHPSGVAYSRLVPSGLPGPAQGIDGAAIFSSPDVAAGPGDVATVVWSGGDDVRSRRIGTSGTLGPTRILDSAPTGNDYYYNPQIATAADGSAGVAWSWQRWAADVRLGVKAVRIDSAGLPATAQVLVGARPDRYFFRELPQIGGGAGTLLAAWLAPVPGGDSWHLPKSQVEASLFGPDLPPPASASPSPAAVTPRRGIATAGFLVPVRKGKAMLSLRCEGADPCGGVASLVVKQAPKRKRASRARAARELTVGSSPFAVPAGGRKTIAIDLNPKGETAAKAAGAAGLAANLRGPGLKARAVKLKVAGSGGRGRAPRR
jgi:hypothetical protein